MILLEALGRLRRFSLSNIVSIPGVKTRLAREIVRSATEVSVAGFLYYILPNIHENHEARLPCVNRPE